MAELAHLAEDRMTTTQQMFRSQEHDCITLNIAKFELVRPYHPLVVLAGKCRQCLLDRVKPELGTHIEAELPAGYHFPGLEIDDAENMILHISIAALPESGARAHQGRVLVQTVTPEVIQIHSRFAAAEHDYFDHS
jgi:hypothetical protein